MSWPRVLAACALLVAAAAFTSVSSAQITFSPKYIPFDDSFGLNNSGMPVLQQDFNNDGIPDVMNGEYPTVEMLSTGSGNYKVTADGGGAIVSGDFNSDGNADYVLYSENSSQTQFLDVAYGNGKG